MYKIENEVFEITKDNIKVTVVVPIYNSEPYLRDCLESLRTQTLIEIQIIGIDDESKDKSLSILKEYSEKDNRFLPLQQKHKNVPVTRNAGLDLALGKYIYFMDSDDILEKNALEVMYKTAVENNSDMVIGRAYLVDDVSGNHVETHNNKDFKLSSLDKSDFNKNISFYDNPEDLSELPKVLWNTLFRLSYIEDNNFNFDNKQNYFSERVFCIETLINAKKIHFIEDYIISNKINVPRSESTYSGHGGSFKKRGELYAIVEDLIKDIPLYEQSLILLDEIDDIFNLYRTKHELDPKNTKSMLDFIKSHFGNYNDIIEFFSKFVSSEDEKTRKIGQKIIDKWLILLCFIYGKNFEETENILAVEKLNLEQVKKNSQLEIEKLKETNKSEVRKTEKELKIINNEKKELKNQISKLEEKLKISEEINKKQNKYSDGIINSIKVNENNIITLIDNINRLNSSSSEVLVRKTDELRQADKERFKAEEEIRKIRASATYKIGRLFTFIPRAIRKIFS